MPFARGRAELQLRCGLRRLPVNPVCRARRAVCRLRSSHRLALGRERVIEILDELACAQPRAHLELAARFRFICARFFVQTLENPITARTVFAQIRATRVLMP